MTRLTLIFLLTTSLVNSFSGVLGCGYSTCPATYDTTKVQLHIISHSHDDVGWLSTPDGYADGDVNPLLSHVVEALQKNKQRKFVEVEMYYFKRWWQRQSAATHDVVKSLVKSGQLAFANGGWCMNDEASTHYNQIIDQMTLGIQFLRDTFGDCAEPKLSWHIDPFGASREQANLFSQMGFDGHVTNRGNAHLHGEFMWNTSLGHQIFTSRLHNHYSAPHGFNFEDADEITDANKLDKAKTLADLGKKWNTDYGHKGHVLITFGDDFRYKHAERWFSNLDKLIEVVNAEHPDVHLHYSSPHCYIKAVRDLKPKLEVKTEDYFPLWTGHYASRPQVKYLDRYANNLLQTAKQLEVIAELSHTQSLLYEGKNELGVLQHHDAVPGTSRPFVMIDYKERLVSAIRSIQSIIAQGLEKLTRKAPEKQSTHRPFIYTTVNVSDFVHHLDSDGFATVIYNPVVQERQIWVRIPVSDAQSYSVHDSAGAELKNVSFVPIAAKVKSLLGHHHQITHEIVFPAHLPALGFTTYFVTKVAGSKLVEAPKKLDVNADADYVLKGKGLELTVDHKTGSLKSLTRAGSYHKLIQTFAYYPANHSSSAYEFCPQGAAIDLTDYQATVVHAAKYEGFAELTQKVNDWVSQTVRVYEDQDHVEFDWVVGPVSDTDHMGKEVITRFETDLATKGTYFTDANGRQNMKRLRNDNMGGCGGTHQSISHNYYPATTRAIIEDEEGSASGQHQLTLVTDRSVGAASLKDGQLELMIHRRLFDHLGLDINMNDLDVDQKGVIARGKVLLFLDSKNEGAADHGRTEGRNAFMQPVIAFSPIKTVAEYQADHQVHFSALKSPLPDNVHLLTLENWGSLANNEVLVRFENFYQPDDASKLAAPAHISLATITPLSVESAEKTNLIVGQREKVASNDVTLGPQELATFVLKVKRTLPAQGSCGLKWEKQVNRHAPEHSVLAGHELDGSPLYVCRHPETDLVPGKYSPGLHCHVSYGGREVGFDDAEVEVLTAPEGATFEWVPRHGGDPVPDAAFVGGHKAGTDGLPLFVGRCSKNGLVVGKIDEYFYYAYGNQEHRDCVDHEILTC